MNKDKTSKSLTCEISSAVNVANCQALDRLHEGGAVPLCFGQKFKGHRDFLNFYNLHQSDFILLRNLNW